MHIQQYINFINKMKIYFEKAPFIEMSFNILVQSSKILHSTEITDYICQLLKDNITQQIGIDLIFKLAKKLPIPSRALKALVDLLKTPSTDRDICQKVASTLGAIVQAEHMQSQEAYDYLVQVVKVDSFSSYARGSVAFILGEIAKTKHQMIEDVIDSLANIAKNKSLDNDTRQLGMEALAKIGKAVKTASQKVTSFLAQIAKNSVQGSHDYLLAVSLIESSDLAITSNEEIVENNFNEVLSQTWSTQTSDVQKQAGEVNAKRDIQSYIDAIKNGSLEIRQRAHAGLRLSCIAEDESEKSHEITTKLIEITQSNPSNTDSYQQAARTLAEIVKRGMPVPVDAILVVKKIVDYTLNLGEGEGWAAEVLAEIVRRGHDPSLEAISLLEEKVKDIKIDIHDRCRFALALGELVKAGYNVSREFIGLIENIANNNFLINTGLKKCALMLEEIKKTENATPQETLENLVETVKNSSLSKGNRWRAVKTLEKIAKTDKSLSQEALASLNRIISDLLVDVDLRSYILQTFLTISKEDLCLLIANPNQYGLALNICYLTQQPLINKNGNYYIGFNA